MEIFILIGILLICWLNKDRIGNFIASAVAESVEPTDPNNSNPNQQGQDKISPVINHPTPSTSLTFGGIVKGILKLFGYFLVFLITVYILLTYVGL